MVQADDLWVTWIRAFVLGRPFAYANSKRLEKKTQKYQICEPVEMDVPLSTTKRK